MKITLKFISDPGHGWIEVPRALLRELGIMPGQISAYSYQSGANAYLEEDCDAGVVIEALKARGDTVEFEEVYEDPTPIRSMRSFGG